MTTDRSTRKLAVILHADVVGSTALVQRDETLAHERIRDAFHRFSETIQAYGGTLHELRGDALLATFSRASDAVSASLSFQRGNTHHNEALNDDIRPKVRIGISLGEVVIADGTLTGADVVMAQRIEQLAEPGGICIQSSAYDTIPRRLLFDYNSLGNQNLKGFDEPVVVYALNPKPGDDVPSPELAPPTKYSSRKTTFTAAIVVLSLIVVGLFAWLQPWTSDIDRADPTKMAYALPEKPSVAVLPFDNLSNKPERDHFSDGLTEDIIAALSRIPELFVIARNTMFSYKGAPLKVQAVAEELGVQYVLEGSVQYADDNRLRVTAQLADALSGHHIWADRFDRAADELFEIKDEITLNVVSNLQLKLSEGEMVRVKKRYTNSLEAWLLYYEGRKYAFRLTKENNEIAKEILKKSIDLDPKFVPAVALYCRRFINEARFGWSESKQQSFETAKACADRAIRIDDQIADVHQLLMAYHLFYRKHHNEAILHAEKAVDVDPSNSIAHFDLGYAYMKAGEPDRGILPLKLAMRLSPQFPDFFLENLGEAQLMAGRCGEAMTSYDEVIRRNPKSPAVLGEAHLGKALCLAKENKIEQAEAEIQKVIEVNPRFKVSFLKEYLIYRDQDYLDWYLTTVRNLGLPD